MWNKSSATPLDPNSPSITKFQKPFHQLHHQRAGPPRHTNILEAELNLDLEHSHRLLP